MDFKMNEKLDGLYYRAPATPSLCGPYKTVSTYNGCSAEKAEKSQAYSRTDYTMEQSKSDKLISAAEQARYKQILQYPDSVADIVNSKNENEKQKFREFITKFPNLETVLKPLYPKFFAEGYAEGKYDISSPASTQQTNIPTHMSNRPATTPKTENYTGCSSCRRM
jgi:hypothetical protein